MNRIYNLSQRLIASILFIGLFLQSCVGFQNQLVPQEKKQSTRTLELSNNPLINSDKEIVISGGYLASFYEEDGELKADLKADAIQPQPNYKGIPVVIEEGTNLSALTKLDSTTQQSRIQFKDLKNGQLGYVKVFGGSLSGGMMEGDNYQEKEREKERETGYKKNKKELKQRGKTAEVGPEYNKQPQDEPQIKELEEFIEIASKNAEKATGKDIVLVIGNTDAGKSTITNYLLGSELEKADNEVGDLIFRVKDPKKEWAKIGHGFASQTFLPSVHANEDCPIIYCDCPGFNDNREDQVKLNTTIATQLIVNAAERIRAIILVIDAAALSHDRGASIKDICNIVSRFLKGNIDPQSFLFVFNNKTGREMKLDNIYLKIAALAANETEKLKKLAKMREKDKEVEKEYMASSQLLSMLSMMRDNKRHTFLIDLLDNFESKAAIERIVSNLQNIPKNSFDFSGYDESRAEFNERLTQVITNLSNTMKTLLQAAEHISKNNTKIESCEERIEFYARQIGLLDPAKKMEGEDIIQSLKKKCEDKHYVKLEQLTHEKEVERAYLDDYLLPKKNKLLKGWDEEERNCIETLQCDNNAKVRYNGIPFTRIELVFPDVKCFNYYYEDECGRHWKEPRYFYLKTSELFPIQTRIEDKLKGELQIDFDFSHVYFWNFINGFPSPGLHGGFYMCASPDLCLWSNVPIDYKFPGHDSDAVAITKQEMKLKCIEKILRYLCSIRIYAKKRDYPKSKSILEELDNKLAQCETSIKEQDKEIEEVERLCENTKNLIQRYTAEIEAQRKEITDWKRHLEGELERIEREKAAAKSNNKVQQKIKEEAERHLAERRHLIVGVNTLISHGIVEDSKLIDIEQFKEYYQHYSMLLEQGLNYFLSFPEKELPNSLFCPLRSDLLIDPVITKCSHTFSQQDLLLWLSNNKTCPTCRQSVVANELKHNLAIHEAIEEFEKTKNKFS